MAEVVLLIPEPRLLKVFVSEHRRVRVSINPQRQEDVVEPFAEPFVERILFHHLIENRRQRLQASVSDRRQFRFRRQSPSQRERRSPQQPPIVQHDDAVEERRCVLIDICRTRRGLRIVHSANKLHEDAISGRITFEDLFPTVIESASHLRQHP